MAIRLITEFTKRGARWRRTCSEFPHFLEESTQENLGALLEHPPTEQAECEFKREWPSHPICAKHVLGLANSRGGCMIFGVEDTTGDPIGLGRFKDEVDVRNGLQKYLPHPLLTAVRLANYSFASDAPLEIADKRFQVLLIQDTPEYLPYIARNMSGEDLRNDIIYVRSGSSTRPANHEQLQDIINRRLETGHSTRGEIDLQTHIEQLKVLHQNIPRFRYPDDLMSRLGTFVINSVSGNPEPNPNYPDEDLEDFILRMISAKKRRIEIHLDVEHLSLD